MELFSSIIEELNVLSSWLPLVIIAILIYLIIIVPFFKDGKDKSFILLSSFLNFSITIYMFLGGTYISILPFGIFEDFSISDLLPLFSLLIPLAIYSIVIIPYLIYRKIFTIRRFLKFMILPILYIFSMLIFTILSSYGIGAMCGDNEACGYAVFGAFYFGPIIGIVLNAIITILFYRKFIKKLTLNSNEKILGYKDILRSKIFIISLIIGIILIIGFVIYKSLNNFINSSPSTASNSNIISSSGFWKEYKSKKQNYSFKYPPAGKVEEYLDESTSENIVTVSPNKDDKYFDFNIEIFPYYEINNSLMEWWKNTGDSQFSPSDSPTPKELQLKEEKAIYINDEINGMVIWILRGKNVFRLHSLYSSKENENKNFTFMKSVAETIKTNE